MIDQGDNTAIVCMDSVKKRCQRDNCKYYHPPNHLVARVKQLQQQQQMSSSTPFNSTTGAYHSHAGNAADNPSLTNSLSGVGANNTSLSTSGQVVQFTQINPTHPAATAQVTLLNSQPYQSLFANNSANSNPSTANLSSQTVTQPAALTQTFLGHASVGSSQNTSTLTSSLFATANTASYTATNQALQQSFHSSIGTSALGASVNAGLAGHGNAYGNSSLGNSAVAAYGTSSPSLPPSLQQSMMLFPAVTSNNTTTPATANFTGQSLTSTSATVDPTAPVLSTAPNNTSLINANVSLSESTTTLNQVPMSSNPNTTASLTTVAQSLSSNNLHAQNNNDNINNSLVTNNNNESGNPAPDSKTSSTSNTTVAAKTISPNPAITNPLPNSLAATSGTNLTDVSGEVGTPTTNSSQYPTQNDFFSQISNNNNTGSNTGNNNSEVRNTIFDRNDFSGSNVVNNNQVNITNASGTDNNFF